jgi:tRNA dimethylallyltransferase
MIKLLCILGPTASGKSSLAMQLAHAFNGELINADSRQFYRELEIGTAKPSRKERDEIPHHLIDCASIDAPWSVADFISAAREATREISARQKLPILVGGTGLYIRSFFEGLAKIPAITDEIRNDLRKELKTKGLPSLCDELQKCDPDSFARLKSNDTQRIIRALEVFRQTGKPIHSFWEGQDSLSEFDALKIGVSLTRETLYGRINERVKEMLSRGLKDEAKALWTRHPDNAILQKTIGYAEWAELGFDDAAVLNAIQQNTRHFAKRQLTWFRKESGIEWVEILETKKLEKLVQGFMR